jgi:hypothetical protein
MRRRSLLVTFVVPVVLALGLGPASSAAPLASAPLASPSVRDWNLHASNALTNLPAAAIPGAGQTPPVSSLHFAMVQGAVYDAVNAIDGTHQPYLPGLPPASPDASLDAAVATAAHNVLVGLVVPGSDPSLKLLPPATITWLDSAYAASLAAIPDGTAKAGGIAAGAAAAAAMLAARTGDGRYVPFSFTVGTEPGEWRPTPPAFVNDPFAWVAFVKPFLLESGSQLRTRGPHALTSGKYAKEFNEVKELGSASSTSRTAEQTAIALFFTDHPHVMWNTTFRAIAEDQGLSLAEEARLFAMLNMAAADGAISCWNDKAHWSFWRPITAIQLADTDGNRKTDADPGWTPLAANPPYPDHPSGFTCATAAFVHAGQDFFGKDKIAFTLRNRPRNEERSYQRLSDALEDVVDARVWLGIHFRAADVQAAGIGKGVAHWLHKYYFRPVH